MLVKDVATVTVGEQPRLGIAGENQDDDIVQGIVLMRRGEQSSPTIARVEKLVADINNSTILPPGRADRAHLRSQGSDRDHDQDRAREHGGRHRADRIAAVDIPRRPAQRADRGRDDSVCAVLCRQHPGAARRIRQPAVRRRDRFRPDRRCHRHHGGGGLPAAGAYRGPFGRRAGRDLAANRDGHEASCHSHGGRRRVAIDLLRRRHHHRGLPAAVHPERRRRQHLRPDGANLRLCAGRRPACDLYGDAGAERDHPAGACRGNRDPDHAVSAPPLHARAGALAAQPPNGAAGRRRR